MMIYKIQILVACWLLLNILSSEVEAQSISGDPVSYTIEAPESVKAGDYFTIITVFNIEPGWYIYAPIDMNTTRGKIVTKVSFKVTDGFKKTGVLELPDQSRFFDTYSGNNVRMSQKFQVEKSMLPNKQTIKANIIYQTCNDDICYPPVRKKIDIVITVE